MSTVHVICGPIGAGKTTLARRLAQARRAVRFSLDEWVMQLFGDEAPEPMVFAWWADRCDRASARIWLVCQELLEHDLEVILDFGFPSLAQREKYRDLALRAGATIHLHIVTANADVRRERVQARNCERGQTFALPVSDEMFVGSESWWEPPTGAELTGLFTHHTPETSSSLVNNA